MHVFSSKLKVPSDTVSGRFSAAGKRASIPANKSHRVSETNGSVVEAGASKLASPDFRQIAICAPARRRMQTKLTVSTPGDACEQEAERVAKAVVDLPESFESGTNPASSMTHKDD